MSIQFGSRLFVTCSSQHQVQKCGDKRQRLPFNYSCTQLHCWWFLGQPARWWRGRMVGRGGVSQGFSISRSPITHPMSYCCTSNCLYHPRIPQPWSIVAHGATTSTATLGLLASQCTMANKNVVLHFSASLQCKATHHTRVHHTRVHHTNTDHHPRAHFTRVHHTTLHHTRVHHHQGAPHQGAPHHVTPHKGAPHKGEPPPQHRSPDIWVACPLASLLKLSCTIEL